MTSEEILAFQKHEDFEAALRIRRYDDSAKDAAIDKEN